MSDSLLIDASVTIAWLLNEDSSATKIHRAFEKHDLLAPWLWRIEIANSLLVQERRKILPESQANRALALLDQLEVEIIGEPENRQIATLTQFARPYQLTAYDAIYLDLAIRLGISLFTFDKNLIAASKRTGVRLFQLR